MSKTEIRSCEDALRLLAAHLDRELDASTGAELERHLDRCRSCYSRAEFEKRLKERIADLAREPVRPELAGRIDRLIRSFSSENGG